MLEILGNSQIINPYVYFLCFSVKIDFLCQPTNIFILIK